MKRANQLHRWLVAGLQVQANLPLLPTKAFVDNWVSFSVVISGESTSFDKNENV